METRVSDSGSDERENVLGPARPPPRNPDPSWFDKPRARPKKRKKADNVPGLREVARGTNPIREYFKVDTSKIQHHKRAPFNVDYESIKNKV